MSTPTTPDPREAGPEGLRALLIDAALTILEDPDTPLDLRKVAETAGKSRTAPYLVFGKESEGGGLLALRIAVAAEGARMVSERMERAGSSTDDSLLAFRRVASAFLTFVRERPRLFRLMYGPEIGVVSRLSAEGLKAHAEFGDLLHHRMVAERALTDAIRGCQANRLLPKGDPARYTMIAWASLIGVAFLLLDEVLEAAGFETGPEEAAGLVVQSVMGLDAAALEDAAQSFLLAETKGESEPESPAMPTYRELHRPPPLSDAPHAVPSLYRASKTTTPPEPPEPKERWLAAELSHAREPARPPSTRGAEPIPATGLTETLHRYPGLRRAALAQAALRGARILWVDDRPELVRAERSTLERLGIEVVPVRTTAEAEGELRSGPVDLVISDMARPGDPQAGARALDRYHGAAPRVPVIFYVERLDPDRGMPEGATGITNSMDELLHLVVDALERRR